MSIEIPIKEKLPDYEENFGHVAEVIIRDSIREKAILFVEKVEKGTKTSLESQDRDKLWRDGCRQYGVKRDI